jgi:hypothetical protein
MPQIARYAIGSAVHYGVLEDDVLRRLAGTPYEGLAQSGETDALSDARLLCPLDAPRVFGVGANYVAHIAEMGMATPTRPMLFMKPDNAVIGPGEAVVLPHEARVTHYEAELAVVIGRTARRVPEDRAREVILGYTCANDISERVIQKEEMDQGCLLIGKGYDTFCPLGPVIATDLDPGDVAAGGAAQRRDPAVEQHVGPAVFGRRTRQLLEPGDHVAGRGRDHHGHAIGRGRDRARRPYGDRARRGRRSGKPRRRRGR